MPRRSTKPACVHHRPSGQARVRIGGKDIYLGPYGSPQSQSNYERIIDEWLSNRDPARLLLTIDDLAIAYFGFAEGYYRRPDGAPSGEVRNMREALQPLVELFGNTPVQEFGPRRLKMVRDEMIRRGKCRTNINRLMGRVRRLFSWGVENELVDANLHHAIKQVRPLAPGRTDAVESDPIEPIGEEIVNATLPHLPPVVQAMVRLQMLTGARPSEICMLCPRNITFRTDGLWSYQPTHHKTAWRGKKRTILIGPQAQEVLRPYLARPADSFCFSPAESEAERSATRRDRRKTPMTPSQSARRPKGRSFSDRYTKDSYGKAIRRACRLRMPDNLKAPRGGKESKVAREKRLELRAEWERENVWSPNRLRHLRATMVREQFGLEHAAAVLGHGGTKITADVYAAKNDRAAAEVMRLIG